MRHRSWLPLPVLTPFLVLVTSLDMSPSSLQKEGFALPHSPRTQSILVGKQRGQGLEATGHTVFMFHRVQGLEAVGNTVSSSHPSGEVRGMRQWVTLYLLSAS